MSGVVKATIVQDVDDHPDLPGAIEFRSYGGTPDVVAGVAFRCPCGCGREGYLPVEPEAAKRWDFNGDRARPTTTPSIQFVGGCAWHGYLTDGEFRTC
jgi:hypothetical protein